MDTKTTFGIYLAWDYDREEDKINSMAKKGRQLKTGGLLHHTYERSDKNYRYNAMKQKRVQKNYMPYKGINISYLLISAMLITFILMLI